MSTSSTPATTTSRTSRAAGPIDLDTATFPRLLVHQARTRPHAVALQEKRYGIWQTIDFATYRDRVEHLAHGLSDLGVAADDLVAVLGDNRPEWLLTELAVQTIGAAVVGIYPTSVGTEIVHVLTAGEVAVVVAEDQEQVDKLLGLADQLPRLTHVVFYDPHGLEAYDDDMLLEFTAVEKAGARRAADRPDWFDERVAAASPDDVAIICTTSGTTSKPKLAMLSHRNLLSMGRRLLELDPLDSDARFVSFLPLAWIGEQMLTVAAGLQVGFPISFPEAASTQKADLREIGPDVMFSPPRIWESMVSDIQVRLGEAGWLKRTIFAWGYRVGRAAAEARVHGDRVGGASVLALRIAEVVALRPIRDQLGLTRLRRGYTGGAPLGPDVFRFFHAIGVNLKQIYGQTEICGIAVVHADDDVRFTTVGEPIPGTELRIADDGEIQLRSDAVFLGYHANPEETREVRLDDGWLRTGDAGYLDDDHLVVIDRAKDVLRTSDGTMFSPAFIENKLKFSPFVEEAVVFHAPQDAGDDADDAEQAATVPDRASTHDGAATDDAITAIVTIDAETVGTWAEHHHLSYTTYTDLAGHTEVYDLVAAEIAMANEDLPESIRVKRFVLLHKQFDPDDNEITRTRKVRRDVIRDRYDAVIAGLVGDRDHVDLSSRVTYQDGTSVDRELTLAIRGLDGFEIPEASRRRVEWSTV